MPIEESSLSSKMTFVMSIFLQPLRVQLQTAKEILWLQNHHRSLIQRIK